MCKAWISLHTLDANRSACHRQDQEVAQSWVWTIDSVLSYDDDPLTITVYNGGLQVRHAHVVVLTDPPDAGIHEGGNSLPSEAQLPLRRGGGTAGS